MMMLTQVLEASNNKPFGDLNRRNECLTKVDESPVGGETLDTTSKPITTTFAKNDQSLTSRKQYDRALGPSYHRKGGTYRKKKKYSPSTAPSSNKRYRTSKGHSSYYGRGKDSARFFGNDSSRTSRRSASSSSRRGTVDNARGYRAYNNGPPLDSSQRPAGPSHQHRSRQYASTAPEFGFHTTRSSHSSSPLYNNPSSWRNNAIYEGAYHPSTGRSRWLGGETNHSWWSAHSSHAATPVVLGSKNDDRIATVERLRRELQATRRRQNQIDALRVELHQTRMEEERDDVDAIVPRDAYDPEYPGYHETVPSRYDPED